MKKKLAVRRTTIRPLPSSDAAAIRGGLPADDATTSGLPPCLSFYCPVSGKRTCECYV